MSCALCLAALRTSVSCFKDMSSSLSSLGRRLSRYANRGKVPEQNRDENGPSATAIYMILFTCSEYYFMPVNVATIKLYDVRMRAAHSPSRHVNVAISLRRKSTHETCLTFSMYS